MRRLNSRRIFFSANTLFFVSSLSNLSEKYSNLYLTMVISHFEGFYGDFDVITVCVVLYCKGRFLDSGFKGMGGSGFTTCLVF